MNSSESGVGNLIRENGVSAAVNLMHNASTDSEDTPNHFPHPSKVSELQQLPEKGNPDLVPGTHSNVRSQEVRKRNLQ